MVQPVLARLMHHGLVMNVIGPVPQRDVRPALVVWARKKPKPQFRALLAVAHAIASRMPVVFIDDVCAQVINRRDPDEQMRLNREYLEFLRSQPCEVRFSQELYARKFGTDVLSAMIDVAKATTISEFLACLPEFKRARREQLALGEIVHLLLELLLFEQAVADCNVLVIGQFSQAIVAAHRNVSRQAMSAVVVPRLQSEQEVDAYVQRVLCLTGGSL